MTARAVNPGARVLVVGGGYSGERFARTAAARGAQVWLTRRQDNPDATADRADQALHWLRFDSAAEAIPVWGKRSRLWPLPEPWCVRRTAASWWWHQPACITTGSRRLRRSNCSWSCSAGLACPMGCLRLERC